MDRKTALVGVVFRAVFFGGSCGVFQGTRHENSVVYLGIGVMLRFHRGPSRGRFIGRHSRPHILTRQRELAALKGRPGRRCYFCESNQRGTLEMPFFSGKVRKGALRETFLFLKSFPKGRF